MSYLQALFPQLFSGIPYFLAWLVATIIASIMVNRGRGKAEILLLIGCGIMLFNAIAGPFLSAYGMWLFTVAVEHGMSRASAAGMFSVISLARGFWSMAGIVCLVYAFWTKWKTKPSTL